MKERLIILLVLILIGCKSTQKHNDSRYEHLKIKLIEKADLLNTLEVDSGKYTLLMYDRSSGVRYSPHSFHGESVFLKLDSLAILNTSNHFQIPSPLFDVKAYFSNYMCFVCEVDSIYGDIRRVFYSTDSVTLELNLKYNSSSGPQELLKKTLTFSLDKKIFDSFFKDYHGKYDNLRIALKEPLKVKELELFGYRLAYGLDSLPEEIGEMKNLEVLDLHLLDLKKLPQSLKNLTNLKRLDIGYNDFEEFPQQIYELKNLEWLDISLSNLDSIPDGIGELQNLKALTLDNNTFRDFPIAITDLTDLESLSITSANIRSIPNEISNLKKLKRLDLSSFWSYRHKNQITNISNLTTLASLESLDLDFNKIETLPDNLCDLSQLKKLSLLSNPIKAIPENIKCKIDTVRLDRESIERK